MKRHMWVAVIVASVFAWGACTLDPFMRAQAAPAKTAADPVIYLDQGWSKSDRNTFYWISQGSAMLSFDIFKNLELSDSQELFRSDKNLERYGVITSPPDPQSNPEGLPVGFTRDVTKEGRWKGDYVGINCAACHVSELHYKGKRIRIDGDVASHFDFMAFFQCADDALQTTLHDAAKFDRLAARIGATSAEAKTELRKRFIEDAERVHYYVRRIMVAPHEWGPGRMDALTLIQDRKLAIATHIPENWSTPLAPVKPPFLWNAPQGAWTQWAGIAQDPIERNFGETQGVYLPMDLTSKTPAEHLFDSNARLLNLGKIEDLVTHLAPPKWPEHVLGKIDRAKAARGKALFAQNCAGCHNSYPYIWTAPNKYGKRFIQVGIVPQSYVGTDATQFRTLMPYAQTAQLAPYLPKPFTGKPVVPASVLSVTIGKALMETAEKKLNLSPQQALKLHGYRARPLPHPPERSYKAAPRDGIWAEPPYLHNGSVPNLYEMLIPARQRTKKFYVGREFDPVKVGIDTSGNSGRFLFDTRLEGNSNAGHSFENAPRGNGVVGPLLTEDQRWALIEYLKSIPEQPGRVTPFGGPPNAKSGHVKWEGPQ